MKNVNEVNKYLSNISVLITKLHNLHWNVEGIQFMSIHKYTEEVYDWYFDQYDEVAELIKIQGGSPLVRVSDYLANATIKELEAKAFCPKEVLEIVKNDFETMCADAAKIREVANEEDNFALANLMEDNMEYYAKQLWFIKATLKEMK